MSFYKEPNTAANASELERAHREMERLVQKQREDTAASERAMAAAKAARERQQAESKKPANWSNPYHSV